MSAYRFLLKNSHKLECKQMCLCASAVLGDCLVLRQIASELLNVYIIVSQN